MKRDEHKVEKGSIKRLFATMKDKLLKGRDFIAKFCPGIKNFDNIKWRDIWPAIKDNFLEFKDYVLKKYPQILKFKDKKIFKWLGSFFAKHKNWFTRKRCIIAGILLFVFIGGHYLFKYLPFLLPRPVKVAQVISETTPAYLEYVGIISSVRKVDINARVEGFLIERAFVEGDNVKTGDLMFVIDKREYEASLEKSIAQLKKDQAAYEYAVEQVKRYEPLMKKEYVTKEFYDNQVTAAEQAKAAVEADEAQVEQAKLNLSYCTMTSPLDGRIGQTNIHVGNLVGAGQNTLLATIVQLDPIYVNFNPSETEYQKIVKFAQKGKLSVKLTFSDGTEYPQKGTLDFINNEIDNTTSTIRMRAIIPNPDKTLLPGIYMNAKLLLEEVPNTLLIPEQAIGEEQGGSYVLVVGKHNKVEERPIVAGPSYNGMRVIKSGLKAGERVIIEGMQFVKTGMRVRPKEVSTKEMMQKNIKDRKEDDNVR
ncbi:MAG: efflux RND transporter periplasmic adaptor subunit [Pseudomonadota bacterium]